MFKKRLHKLNAHKPPPLTGMDLMLAQWLKGFNIDKEAGIELLERLIDEVEERMEKAYMPLMKMHLEFFLQVLP